jgi:ankyrin repeat protein
VETGDSDVVEVLVIHGADPNARWCVTSQFEREGGNITYQLMAGCERDRGMTPLMLAASLDRVDIVEVLLRHGADSALRDWQDKTAVDHASPTNRERVASALSGR